MTNKEIVKDILKNNKLGNSILQELDGLIESCSNYIAENINFSKYEIKLDEEEEDEIIMDIIKKIIVERLTDK